MVKGADNASERPLPDGRGSDWTANVTRHEWMVVAVLFVIGTTLRCWQPSHMAVEHFDEGVYASNLYSPGGAYPYRHLYAPPLLPFLLEWALIFSGGAAGSVMWVNVIAGSLTVPSLWWVGRQWFGPLAGIAAAALCALSQMHILYSRTALTDVLLCLWMLWGVYWAWKAIIAERPPILLAIVFSSLAWWTKYNGWLTLAISGAGMVAWVFCDQLRSGIASSRGGDAIARDWDRSDRIPRTSQVRAILAWGTIASLVGLTTWIPLLVHLKDHGGYAVVSANHAKYFVGLAGWGEAFLRQWANLDFIESLGGATGLGLIALLLVGTRYRDVTERRLAGAEVIVIAAFLLAIGLVAPITVVTLLAVAAIGRAITSRAQMVEGYRQSLADWMLAAWIVGLLVAIPLYTPYPRLTLSLLSACWLGAGLAFTMLMGEAQFATGLPDDEPRWQWQLPAACVILVAAVPMLLFQDEAALEDRSRLQTIAGEIHEMLPVDRQALVTVLGEPALYFQLSNQSQNPNWLIHPGGDFASVSPPDPSAGPVEMYVVYGPHVMRHQDPAAGVSWAEANLTQVAEWGYRPSTLVLLNEYPPEAIKNGDVEPSVIRLARIGE